MAKGIATSKSDIDIEIIFKNRKKPYELSHKKVNGIKIDLSIYSLRKFKEDFSNKPYYMYSTLGGEILYDPKGIVKKNLGSIEKAFLSPLVWTGLFAYFVGSVFWILALSQKDLSYAYPMLSLGYLLVILISWTLLNEEISLIRLAGVLFISFGLFLVFKSA